MDDVLTDENDGRKSSLEILMLKSPFTPSKTEEFESETNENAARRLSEQSNEEELRLVNVDKPKLVPTVRRATSLPQLNESVPPSMFQLINGTDKTCTFLVIGVTFGQVCFCDCKRINFNKYVFKENCFQTKNGTNICTYNRFGSSMILQKIKYIIRVKGLSLKFKH